MLLDIKNLSYHYHRMFSTKRHCILKHISFSLPKASTLALIGPSGCGKSTLAKAIAQLITCDKDSIMLLHGKRIEINTLAKRRAFYQQVQILFQDSISSLNPRLSVIENLQEPLLNLLGIKDKKQRIEMARKAIEPLDLEKDVLYKYPLMLSGGQAQRICVARALMIQPKLLVLDESMQGFDYELQERVWNLLLDLQAKSACSYIFITHDIALAKRFCNMFMLMSKGAIVEFIKDSYNSKKIFSSDLGLEFESCYYEV